MAATAAVSSMVSPLSPHQPILSRRVALLGYLVILVLLGALAAFAAWQSRHHYRQQAETTADNLAQLLARQIGAVAEKIDLALGALAPDLESRLAGGAGPGAVDGLLRRQKALLPDVLDLHVADAEGLVRYSTGALPPRPASLADQPWFMRLRDVPRAGMAVDGPRPDGASGQWVTVFARRLNRPDGAFAGLIYASVATEHLGQMLSSLSLGPRGLASLRNGDLVLIDRFPHHPAAWKPGARDASEAYQASVRAHPGQGLFVARNTVDGIERTLAYRQVAGLPWYVAVGLATEDYLAAWWREVRQLAGILCLFGLVTLWLLSAARLAARRQEDASRLLQEAVDGVAIGFSVFDARGRLVVCNQASREFLQACGDCLVSGASLADIVRAGVARGLYPEAAADPEAWIRERLGHHRRADGRPFEQTLADGRQFMVIERRLPSGHTVANRIDITELSQYRRQLEARVEARTAALAALAAQFRIFVEQAPTAIAMFDRDMRYLAASRRWLSERHGDSTCVIGQSLYDDFPDIPERWKEAHRAALAGIPQEKAEDRWVRANGGYQWKRWSVYPWRDEGGAVGGIIVSAEDITDRKLAQQRLQESELRFRSTFEQAAVGLTHYALDGRLLRANDKYCAILGYGREELLGTDCQRITYPEDARAGLAEMGRLQAGDIASFSIEKRYVRQDGAVIWCGLTVALVRTAAGAPDYFVVAVEDIQSRRDMEAALAEERQSRQAILERQVAERTAELQAANRQLEGFIYASSHDLKGPLGRINSFSALLERNYRERLEGDGLLFLGFIRENATRLTKLIDDLLRHARIDRLASTLQIQDLADAVQGALEEMAEEIRETGAAVRVDLPAVAMVLADPHGLSQVLRNVLGNALKYSAQAPEPAIDIGGEVLAGRFRLWVRDNGIGFPMEYHEKIFEIFRRLHTYAEYPGTGVGLALVKRAMERMGGKVWAESAPGQGATFYLELVAAEPVRRALPDPQAEAAAAPRQRA